jgi:hypothetical protein
LDLHGVVPPAAVAAASVFVSVCCWVENKDGGSDAAGSIDGLAVVD